MKPYLVLLRVEFTLQLLLPAIRCALTAPFQPYLFLLINKSAIGGLLSAALVVGSRRPGVTWHPAHWSPDFPPLYLSTLRHNDKAAIVSSTRRAFYSI